MPAKGKHRRPRPQRRTRSVAVAGTSGAALALPLIGTTAAHAAPPGEAPRSVAEQTVRSAAGTAEQRRAAEDSVARTYVVRPGDRLAKIADEQHVSGGWQRIYEDNRPAIGGDPSLIHPGLKLTLGGRAEPDTHSAQPSRLSRSSYVSAAGASAGRTARTAGTGTSTGYGLPVLGARIGTGYHVAGGMWSSGYHTGVDFVAPTGTSVRAVAAGTVVTAGWGGAYGNQVVVRLADGYYAQYAHLSQLSVSVGQTVTEGLRLGLSGATGNVTGPHLHFEIRTTPEYGSDVDPLAYLRSHGVVV
ncbi:peptidoglycan DD-metalloendopeptidase family protein [Streptomyces sp. MMS24-I2-30]|uniref:M23 family metallopeptidase n=1 Tax=Streptomyces sp. MMS24-I2-30 TaxID=3351564 RepID=UPI003896C8DC